MIARQMANVVKHMYCRRRNRPCLPNYAVFMITRRCNMTCSMCGVEKRSGDDDLDINGYKKLFDTGLKGLDVVKITGGEPFIRKDAGDIMRLIIDRAKPRVFHVTTNGYFTDRIDSFLSSLGRGISMSISLDGTEKLHNEIRGLPDAYEHAVETLNMVKKSYPNVKLTVNCTVSSYNYKNFNNLQEEMKKVGVDRVAYFIADSNDNYDDSLNLKGNIAVAHDDGSAISDADKKKLYEIVEENNRSQGLIYRLLNDYYIKGVKRRSSASGDSDASHKCMALWSYFRMDPNGDIIMCLIKPQVVGNIKDEGFRNLWFNERTTNLRAEVVSCSQCWKECEVIPSCVYSGDLFKHILKGEK